MVPRASRSAPRIAVDLPKHRGAECLGCPQTLQIARRDRRHVVGADVRRRRRRPVDGEIAFLEGRVVDRQRPREGMVEDDRQHVRKADEGGDRPGDRHLLAATVDGGRIGQHDERQRTEDQQPAQQGGQDLRAERQAVAPARGDLVELHERLAVDRHGRFAVWLEALQRAVDRLERRRRPDARLAGLHRRPLVVDRRVDVLADRLLEPDLLSDRKRARCACQLCRGRRLRRGGAVGVVVLRDDARDHEREQQAEHEPDDVADRVVDLEIAEVRVRGVDAEDDDDREDRRHADDDEHERRGRKVVEKVVGHRGPPRQSEHSYQRARTVAWGRRRASQETGRR